MRFSHWSDISIPLIRIAQELEDQGMPEEATMLDQVGEHVNESGMSSELWDVAGLAASINQWTLKLNESKRLNWQQQKAIMLILGATRPLTDTLSIADPLYKMNEQGKMGRQINEPYDPKAEANKQAVGGLLSLGQHVLEIQWVIDDPKEKPEYREAAQMILQLIEQVVPLARPVYRRMAGLT